jgi:hypothetical protein
MYAHVILRKQRVCEISYRFTVPVDAVKAYGEMEVLPHFLLTSQDLELSGLYQGPLRWGKSVQYPLKWSLDGTQGRSGRFGEDNKSLTSTRNRITISYLYSRKPSHYTECSVLTVTKLTLKPNMHEAWGLLFRVMWCHVTGRLVSDVSIQLGGRIFKGRNVR